jgi:cyclin-A
MRTILISWLIEVANEYSLDCQTLHLSVYLLDAYLTRRPNVPKTNLQLVGVTCVLIAGKYEELHPPSPKDCSYITDYTYTPEQVIAMEHSVLTTIQFQVSAVTSLEFRRRFQCEHPLVNYLLELALLQPLCLNFKPSQLAVSTCAYVRAVIGGEIWPEAMVTRSGYTFDEVRPIIVHIRDLHRKNFGLSSIRHSKVMDILPLKYVPTYV